MASTRLTRCPGSSNASSRVPVARPTTCTAHRNGPSAPRSTVHPVAPSTSVAWPTATPHAPNEVPSVNGASLLEPFGERDALRVAGAAPLHAAQVADHADEGAAHLAGVSFRGALFISARAADHRVAFVEVGHSTLLSVIRAGTRTFAQLVLANLLDERRARDPELARSA